MNTFIALWKEKNIASEPSRNIGETQHEALRTGSTGMFLPVLTYLKLPAGCQPAPFAWLTPERLCSLGRKRIWLSIITDISILSGIHRTKGKNVEQMIWGLEADDL